MPAKNPFGFSLPDKEADLLRKAIKKYKKFNISQTELIRKIICSWLFANRLQIENSK